MIRFSDVICILAVVMFSTPVAMAADGDQAATPGVNSWNLSFGLGVEQFRDPYIDTAGIRGDDKIVVIQKSYETLPSAWLTVNWNVFGEDENPLEKVDLKWGFFAGVKLIDSNDASFSAFSLGPQVSFALKEQVISVGAGWVTHRTRQFAKGITEGAALPEFYDDLEYEEGTENS